MISKVSDKDKKEFIQWVLKNHQLRKRESIWILNYILGDGELLENIHIVEDAKHCPRALVTSTVGTRGVTFRYYTEGMEIKDPEKAFHDIRLNKGEPLYLEIKFPNSNDCPQYWAVLEENTYTPKDEYDEHMISKHANELIEESMLKFKKSYIMNEIDVALDKKDEAKFKELTSELLQLSNG